MKVSQLIALLEDLDPDANVLIMSQQRYPWESAISGVTTREEMLGTHEDLEYEMERGTHPNDVFIVEGEQVRRGDRNAWDVCVK